MSQHKTISLYLLSTLLALFASHVGVFASNNDHKGEAVINVDNKTYRLPVQSCDEPSTGNYDGVSLSHFSILAHKKADNEPGFPKLSIDGVKKVDDVDSWYEFELDGNTYSGGVSYTGQMPYEIFNEKKLYFQGKTSRSQIGADDIDMTIEITVTCN